MKLRWALLLLLVPLTIGSVSATGTAKRLYGERAMHPLLPELGGCANLLLGSTCAFLMP